MLNRELSLFILCIILPFLIYDHRMKKLRGKAMKPLMSQLAVRIVDRVRGETLPAGAHLAEQVLADAFHVSRGPVREALTILEREGLVLFHPNRGFFLTRASREIPAPEIPAPVSTEDEMYYRFAEDRIRGKLRGHISEAELMARYGISRVKLMKILIRMSQEGWVERRPGHGWNFLPVLDTVEALDKSYRFRILVEPAAPHRLFRFILHYCSPSVLNFALTVSGRPKRLMNPSASAWLYTSSLEKVAISSR